MSYTRNNADYEAIQWDGNNQQEVSDKVQEYFLFDAPSSVDGSDNLVFDLSVSSVNTILPLNGWFVYGGKWGTLATNEQPEFLTDGDFQQKYT